MTQRPAVAPSSVLGSACVAVLNMGARGLGLVGRFGLIVYMARDLPLSDVGVFGLVAGAAGLMPALSGLGLNFYLGRELVGRGPVEAGVMIRDRLAVTVVVVGAILAMAALGQALHPSVSWAMAGLVGLIVFGETIAFDLHMSLISLRRPLLANMLLFVRSAAWALPVIAWGIVDPRTRHLSVVLEAWAGGLGAYYVCLVAAFRGWPVREIADTSIDWALMRRTARRGWLIYVNDIGIAGSLYLDRYVVAHVLGLAQTGVFTLYWSIANGLYVLVTSAVAQVSLPDLVQAFRRSEPEWLAMLERQLLKIAVIAVPLSLAIFLVTQFVLPRFGVARLAERPGLFIAMLAGNGLRLGADMMNYGLYSRGLDRQLATINIAGLVLIVALDLGLTTILGLGGAGVALIVTPLVLGTARIVVLHRAGAPAVFAARAVARLRGRGASA